MVQLSVWDFNLENTVGVSWGRKKIIYCRNNSSQDSVYVCDYFCQKGRKIKTGEARTCNKNLKEKKKDFPMVRSGVHLLLSLTAR